MCIICDSLKTEFICTCCMCSICNDCCSIVNYDNYCLMCLDEYEKRVIRD